MDSEEDDDITESRLPRDHVIRKSTKVELGLAAGLTVNLVAVVWFAATMASKVDTVTEQMRDAITEIRAIRSQAPAAAVLQYRVEKLEEQFKTTRR